MQEWYGAEVEDICAMESERPDLGSSLSCDLTKDAQATFRWFPPLSSRERNMEIICLNKGGDLVPSWIKRYQWMMFPGSLWDLLSCSYHILLYLKTSHLVFTQEQIPYMIVNLKHGHMGEMGQGGRGSRTAIFHLPMWISLWWIRDYSRYIEEAIRHL